MLAASPVLLAAADLLENAACVVTGDAALARAALTAPDPAVVVLQASGQALSPGHPAAEKKTEQAAFVCQGGVCALPVTTAEALRALLRPLAKT